VGPRRGKETRANPGSAETMGAVGLVRRELADGSAKRGVGRGHDILPCWGAATSPQANPAVVARGDEGRAGGTRFRGAGQG
jgi:hypothetical protein